MTQVQYNVSMVLLVGLGSDGVKDANKLAW